MTLFDILKTLKRINISLSDKVKQRADQLVAEGYYSSFSELVRVGLRVIIDNYDDLDKLKRQARVWKRFDRTEELNDFLEKL